MHRNLKALGLTLAAAFTMSAMMAASAQAQTITTGKTGPPLEHTTTNLVGEIYAKEGGNILTENSFTSFGNEISCTNVTYTATVDGGTAHELDVAPHYSHCGRPNASDELTTPSTVTMNGCTFLFTTPKTLEEGNTTTFTSLVHLACPEGQHPEIDVYNSGTYTAHEGLECTVHISASPANQNLGPVLIHNIAGEPDDLTVTIDVEGVHATRTGLCAIFGGNTEANGRFKSNVTLKDAAGLDDVWISHEVE